MCPEAEREFVALIKELSVGIGRRMKPYFPIETIKKMCIEFPENRLKEVFPHLRRDWYAHVYHTGEISNHEELVTIFMINLIGGLNRINIPNDVDRAKIIHIYGNSFERMLSYAKYRDRFVTLSNLMMARSIAA